MLEKQSLVVVWGLFSGGWNVQWYESVEVDSADTMYYLLLCISQRVI
jgi:hypothetical protein